jgi:hypothetical protein
LDYLCTCLSIYLGNSLKIMNSRFHIGIRSELTLDRALASACSARSTQAIAMALNVALLGGTSMTLISSRLVVLLCLFCFQANAAEQNDDLELALSIHKLQSCLYVIGLVSIGDAVDTVREKVEKLCYAEIANAKGASIYFDYFMNDYTAALSRFKPETKTTNKKRRHSG